MAKVELYKIFYNPAGFIEVHFLGEQTPDSVIGAVRELVKWSKKLNNQKQKVLVLADVTEVPKIDISGKMAPARKEAVKAMSDAEYDRIAVYGNVVVQILVNTLALIAGKRQKIKVFSDRTEAVRWLKGGG
jgi:predicted glycosyltransferase